MGIIYLFDRYFKKYVMKGTKAVNPSNTGIFDNGVSCVREDDVNIWFYTKSGNTIAFDSGHRDFKNVNFEFEKIKVNSNDVKNVFMTHVDVDHAGGMDKKGNPIFPNAQVYIGNEEEQYLTGKMYRMKKLGFLKLKVGVSLKNDYKLLSDGEVVNIGNIKIEAIHIPGHTLGHMCYLIDDSILITGDCLAINKNGGYPFWDFFTQNPELNRKSLQKLKKIVEDKKILSVCTGHSGYRKYNDSIFAHIDETADYGKKKHFDEEAPEDYTKY